MALNSRENFIPLLKYFPVKPTCIAIYNSQANYILERIHQVIGRMLKIKYLANTTFDAVSQCSKIIASITYVLCLSYYIMLPYNPGQLVFGRNKLLEINLQPNYKEM